MWFPGKNVISGIRKIGHGIMDNRREKQALQDRAMGPAGPAPQIAGADQAYAADRGAQGTALGAYGAAMAGQGPSIAQQQLAAGNQANTVTQMGMAAQTRGGSMASQARSAAGIGAAGAMAGNRDAAMLRASEIDAARAGYANQANTMAGMSAGQLGQNADLATQWGLGQRGMDLEALKQKQDHNLAIADRIVGAAGGAAQMGMMGASMFSDERLKTDMRPADEDAADVLASLRPTGYRYKSERHGPTKDETLGITAQDLLKTKVGRRLVREVEGEGLAVDMPGSVSLLLAGSAGLEKRMRKLEGRA
jgi:hypothetical protein